MPLSKPLNCLISLPRSAKKTFVLVVDVATCFMASWLAFAIRYDDVVGITKPVKLAVLIGVILFVPIFMRLGLYRTIYRFSGWSSAQSIIRACLIYAIAYSIPILIIGIEGIPRSVGIVQPVLFFVFIGLLRLFANFQLLKIVRNKDSLQKRPCVLIYGAGSAGRQLVAGLRQGSELDLIGFVDDNPELCGGLIIGLPVFHPSRINNLITSKGVTEILLAIPSASRRRHKEILANLSGLPVHVRTLPGLSDLANGVVKVEDIREVEVDDVLGRESVEPDKELLLQNLTGKVIMVSGAGGSIGSELCRQILLYNPKMLVLYDLSEFALYKIERELVMLKSSVKVVPILGSVLDGKKIDRIILQFQVDTIYHAAAYKHVPLIELNPSSGILNNVFGTLTIVDSACRLGVDTFVLVSTDKAVRPTNVMGCSKRISELIVQAKGFQESIGRMQSTKLTMVRFGNVLGSSGSVVPIFREQIRNGGPVTVTHPEIVRYFMTIPEAAQLVIQAGAIGEGGDVLVLDMGEPIKILDLAKRMIHLSGFSDSIEGDGNGCIEIQFTGLRPGEKLYEELLIGDNTLPTSHARIKRAQEHFIPWEELNELLIQLEGVVKDEDNNKMLSVLKKIVPEFHPSLVDVI